MKKLAVFKFLILNIFIIASCTSLQNSNRDGKVDILEPGVSLQIMAPHESNLYPQNTEAWESYPLVLKFNFGVLGNQLQYNNKILKNYRLQVGLN